MISTFHLPIRFGDCVWAIAMEHSWAMIVRIKLEQMTHLRAVTVRQAKYE